MSSKKTVTEDLLKVINSERDYVPYFGTFLRILVYMTLALIFFLNFASQSKFLRSKKIIIKNKGSNCKYEAATLTVLDNSDLKDCVGSDGKINPNFKIYTEKQSGDKYIIGDTRARYFRTVCNGFCVLKPDGTCEDQPLRHQRCLNLLNPGENCTNNSKPIGYYQEKNWFAVSVRQTYFCTNFNTS